VPMNPRGETGTHGSRGPAHRPQKRKACKRGFALKIAVSPKFTTVKPPNKRTGKINGSEPGEKTNYHMHFMAQKEKRYALPITGVPALNL